MGGPALGSAGTSAFEQTFTGEALCFPFLISLLAVTVCDSKKILLAKVANNETAIR